MKRIIGFALILMLSLPTMAATTTATPQNEQQAIAQRISPVGDSKLMDDSQLPPLTLTPEAVSASVAPPATKTPVAPIKPATSEELARGKQIYDSKCHVCHESGLAGAPKFGDAAAWAPRSEKGLQALVQTAKTGLNAMPPKGTCTECSDQDLQDAIQYMLSQSGGKKG